MNKAESFVVSVMEAFRDQREKYEEFLKIANDGRNHIIDEATAITRMTQLMKGHRNLLLGLREIFPNADITISPKPEELAMSISLDSKRVKANFKPKTRMNKAELFVVSVMEAFRDQREKYEEFLKIANDGRNHIIDEAGVVTRMTQLMKGHRNLLLGLREILPNADITIPPTPEELTMSNAMTFLNNVKIRFQIVDVHVYPSVLRELQMYKQRKQSLEKTRKEVLNLLYYHEDLTEQFLAFCP